MRILLGAAAALALSGLFTLAQADADPKLQALIDQRAGQESADSQRLTALVATGEERQALEKSLGGASQQAIDATREFKERQTELQQSAQQVEKLIRNLLANPDQASADQVKAVDDASEQFRKVADAVLQSASKVGDVGGADEFKVTLNSTTFIGDVLVLIGVETKVAFAASELERNGDLDQSSIVINGTLAQRLLDVSESINNVLDETKAFDDLVLDLDQAGRLEELRASEDQRNREIQEIKQRQDFDAQGGDVLNAFGERLNGSAGTSDLRGDSQAGDRVRELAEGLAGAGQRLAEIDQRQNELDQIEKDLDQQIREIDERRDEIDFLLGDQARQEQHRDALENLVGEIDAAIELNIEQGADDALAELEAVRDQVQGRLDSIDDFLANAEPLSDEQRRQLLNEQNRLFERRNEASGKSGNAFDEFRALELEKQRIAALQGELADLIRRGAPLGDGPPASDASVALDGFLAGGDDSSDDGIVRTEARERPDILRELGKMDPLGLDQFGFDADQGATEDITGFNGDGGLNLIPCPPGSNALPVGTLVSDTAFCFT